MNFKNYRQMVAITGTVFMLFIFSGCKGKTDAPPPSAEKPAVQAKPVPPEKPAGTSEALKPGGPTSGIHGAMPSISLTGLKITEDDSRNLTMFHITLSGDFLYNVVQKADPDRIMVVLHKTTKGKAPEKIEVNNGTISRVEIAELNTERGAAVRITIRLTGKTTYDVLPLDKALYISVLRKT